MIHWIYVIIASVFEVGWIYSLKFLQFKKLIKTSVVTIFTTKEGWLLLTPAILYVLLGLGNIIFFSKSMEKIPASVAFAVWMAVALLGVRIVDSVFFKEQFSPLNIFFFIIIIIGIIGLKITSPLNGQNN
jgi:quaternary ammonium compound-resistance protein SugE